MAWFPLGPDTVFSPRDSNYLRLSRRNEVASQGAVTSIAIVNAQTLYAVVRPDSSGTAVWRSDNDGESWVSLFDDVHRGSPPEGGPDTDACCVAVRSFGPGNETVIVGTQRKRRLYWSFDRGGTWASLAMTGGVTKIFIDPRSPSDPAQPELTGLFVATDHGLWHFSSITGTPSQVLDGNISSLVAHVPASGAVSYWAGVAGVGLFHSTEPANSASWSNLNTGATGSLPSPAVVMFGPLLVDFCPLQPERVYVWAAPPIGVGSEPWIYTTGAGASGPWTPLPATTAPRPFVRGGSQNERNFVFAVAPNSPGDGTNDILFFGNQTLWRSIDAGTTWIENGARPHPDYYAIAFYPPIVSSATVVPAIYVTNDGSIEKSIGFANPSADFAADATGFNSRAHVDNTSAAWQNLAHGLTANALFGYASDPAASAVGYIGSVDTGLAVGAGALAWRSASQGDHGVPLALRGPDGMTVWTLGGFEDFPTFPILRYVDHGDYASSVIASLGGIHIGSTSNFTLERDDFDGDRGCVVGGVIRDLPRLLTAAVPAGAQDAHPMNLNEMVVGGRALVDDNPMGVNYGDLVQVESIDTVSGTFHANFHHPHLAGAPVKIQRALVVRVDRSGNVTPLSQNLAANSHEVFAVAASPTTDVLVCATRRRSSSAQANLGPDVIDDPLTVEQRLFLTDAGSRALSTWIEPMGFPAGAQIASLVINSAGEVRILLLHAVTASGLSTPLFRLALTGATWQWVAENCSGAPSFYFFGKIVADPDHPETLYASHGGRVYRLTRSGPTSSPTWTWTNISDGADGLPGRWIADLWIGNIAPPGAPTKLLLRAATAAGGVWEKDVSASATDPPIALYVRDNFLDHGWLNPSPDGEINPFRPSEHVWHWQSPDIKVEEEQSAPSPDGPFFQSSLVFNPDDDAHPLSHIYFDMLRERVSVLTPGAPALVHVQVRNRSRTLTSSPVWVWALWCHYAAGLPALNGGRSSVHFWEQFQADGIDPTLPTDAAFPWTAVGPPKPLATPIDAAHPGVVSWRWTIPTPAAGSDGHYCVAVFVHSAAAPVAETTRLALDEITPTNRQVTHRNFQIGPPIPPGSPGMGGGAAIGGGSDSGGAASPAENIINIAFHNPTAKVLKTSLVFDLASLPPDAAPTLQLANVQTAQALDKSIVGIVQVKKPGFFARLFAIVRKILRWLWSLFWKDSSPGYQFDPRVFYVQPGGEVKVSDVLLGPFDWCRAKMSLRIPKGSDTTVERRVDIMQLIDGKVFGGATYVVPAAENEHEQSAPEEGFDEHERAGERIPSLKFRAGNLATPWIIESMRYKNTFKE